MTKGSEDMNYQKSSINHVAMAQTRTGALCLVLLSLMAPAAVIAGPHHARKPETVATAISLANLDLTTPTGIDAAHQRLAIAAQRLCRKFSDSRRVDDYQTYAECYREALSDAVRRLDAHLKRANADAAEVAENTP